MEIYLLIRVSAAIGFLNVLLCLVLAASIGARLLQTGSWTVLKRVQSSIAAGEPPARALLDSAMIMLAGLLLIIPGFLTDLAGLMFLVPASRRRIVAYLERQGASITKGAGRPPPASRNDVIEGEYRRDD